MTTKKTKMTVQIKHRYTDAVLFECEVPGSVASGLRMRHAMEKATEARADLRYADLRYADLRHADLRYADLRYADLRHADLRHADFTGADLTDADLTDADLRHADFTGAYLTATPDEAIANLDRVREIVLDNVERLKMNAWHKDDSWKKRTCAEETLCGTTHCLAGWLQVCSTNDEIRKMTNTYLAGILSAPVASSMFFADAQSALDWLRTRKYAEAA